VLEAGVHPVELIGREVADLARLARGDATAVDEEAAAQGIDAGDQCAVDGVLALVEVPQAGVAVPAGAEDDEPVVVDQRGGVARQRAEDGHLGDAVERGERRLADVIAGGQQAMRIRRLRGPLLHERPGWIVGQVPGVGFEPTRSERSSAF
jgi:hypothetical protein